MKFKKPKIIKKKVFSDARGTLQEIYRKKDFSETFIFSLLVSCKKNVFRGLHFQKNKQQAKLVVVASGKIIDYCLDLRRKSPTYLKLNKYKLKKNDILYIPKGFAHGYLALENKTKIIYFLSQYYSKKDESGINYNDEILNLNFKRNIIISKKDQKNISVENFKKKFKSL